MTQPAPAPAPLPDLPGGPYDIEFFFDPGCPFAWLTSVWARRVAELRGVRIGWRFISLRYLNEDNDVPAKQREAQERGLGYHRICAAARERFGNEAVGALYRAYGEAQWYTPGRGSVYGRLARAAAAVDVSAVLTSLDLPADLREAADDDSWDTTIRDETEEALRRTGDDVGTPIITFDPPGGNSLFGPVISSVPDDDLALRFYDALRTFADFPAFSELKRSDRAPIDLPLLTG